MRGQISEQTPLFSYINIESRVPKNHPLRRIRATADEALGDLGRDFEAMYSHTGRPSIPPEVLLKSMVIQCLYSIKSDRLFCEALEFNLLFRWFLGMGMDESAFDHSVFSKNRERLLEHDVSRMFFQKTVDIALNKKLISNEHFSVDGTLIEAWASMKSFKKKDSDTDDQDPPQGNQGIDFKGERRSNETHQSTTDPEARLFTKNKGQTAKLSYGGHALMENREGLIVDVEVTEAGNKVERDAAKVMIKRIKKKRSKFAPKSLGADKGYHASEFTNFLKEEDIKPHVAKRNNMRLAHVDGRVINSIGYQISMRKRKRIEEFFGWAKVNAGLRKIRFIGKRKAQAWMEMVAGCFNLLRMSNIEAA